MPDLEAEVDRLKAELTEVKSDVEGLRQEQRDREVSQLKWGVRVLGTVVLVLAGWIWSQVSFIFDLGNNR